jgi:pimeloyl-ACP methyl ester carboxylesterase
MSRIQVLIIACAIALANAHDATAEARGNIKSHEHQVERAGMQLSLWEKWSAGEESKWKTNGKVILLVHGATWSSRCTFDVADGYSLMDDLAEQGYDVFAIDLHGYGKSGKTEHDWTESPSASDDVDAAADYIRALRWVEKIHVVGYQWGAQPAGIFAMKHPNKIAKLVLFGMRYNSPGQVTEPTTQYRSNRTSATLKPEDGDLDPDFVRRRGQICLKYDPSSPNGALRDMGRQSFVDPTRVKAQTLMVNGERDMDAAELQDRIEFYKALGSRTKQFSVLGGLGKYANIEKNRARFEAAIINFLEQP